MLSAYGILNCSQNSLIFNLYLPLPLKPTVKTSDLFFTGSKLFGLSSINAISAKSILTFFANSIILSSFLNPLPL